MKSNRREFLVLSAAAITAAGARAADAPATGERAKDSQARERADRPNIVILLTDQQHAGMLSCAGNRNLKTPNMDSLAASGTRFERAYCGNPVCLPSRFSMLTGLLPSANGIEHNGNTRPVPEEILQSSLGRVFRRAGYRTVYGGKTHLPPPQRAATTSSAGKSLRGRDAGGLGAYGFDEVLSRDQREPLARAAADFLRRPQDRPFLMVVSLINPHDICFMAIHDHALRERADREGYYRTFASNVLANKGTSTKPTGGPQAFAPGEMEKFVREQCPPLPANYDIPAGEPEGLETLDWRAFRAYVRKNWTEQQWRLHRWAYARLTERVDSEIGLVLAGLREGGRERDTLVVLISDHGDMDSAHRLEHKSMLYEEATRVPLVLSLKGVTSAGAVDREHLASTGLDLIPTLCDFAGIAPPAGRAGRSLRPLALGRSVDNWRDSLVVENEKSRLVLWDRYKYIVYASGTQREQVIDLRRDPGEMTNLARDDASRPLLLEGRRRLRQWYRDRNMKLGAAYVVE